jgi:chloramphenicol 3-O-phosphotransferase
LNNSDERLSSVKKFSPRVSLPMIVLINGSFGVGKTTVARLLRGALRGSRIYDPEWAGIILMRLTKWARLKRVEDFQDMGLWRKSAVAGIRLFRVVVKGPVIVPMTFSQRAYFDEVLEGVRRLDSEVRVFCLKASLPTVEKRLLGRGTKIEGPGSEWIARRIKECAEAHRDTHYGEPVETEERSAREVAEDVIERLRKSSAMAA